MSKEIEIVVINELDFLRFEEENISGVLLPSSNFTSTSAGIVMPGEAQASHYQERPGNGTEIILVYEGHFEVVGAAGTMTVHDCATKGPLFIQVASKAVASLRNVGNIPVRFFSVFAPPFEPGEIKYL